MSCHFFLASMVSGENSTVIHMQVSSDPKSLLKKRHRGKEKDLWGLGDDPQPQHF